MSGFLKQKSSPIIAGDALFKDGVELDVLPDNDTLDIGLGFNPDGSTNSSTTDETTTGFATATSDGGAGLEAIRAFNNVLTDAWAGSPAQSLPQSIGQDYGADNAKVINKFRILADSSKSPVDFKLRGSHDNINFQDLYSVTGENTDTSPSWGAWRTFVNSTPYRYYDLQTSAKQGGSSDGDVKVKEIEMVEAESTAQVLKIADEYKDKIQSLVVLDLALPAGAGNINVVDAVGYLSSYTRLRIRITGTIGGDVTITAPPVTATVVELEIKDAEQNGLSAPEYTMKVIPDGTDSLTPSDPSLTNEHDLQYDDESARWVSSFSNTKWES